MDIATLIGLVLGCVLLVGAILLGGDFGMFVNIPSILVVVGGTIASLFIRYQMAEAFSITGIMGNAFSNKQEPPEDVINQIIDMASIARKDGILALEKVKSENVFLQSAINHCVDGADPEFLEAVLEKDMAYLGDRHAKGIDMMAGLAEAAPAFGMIGTLIGLVQMLANMSDPSAIGPAMAVALLTTLYGAVIANLFFLPIGKKLDNYSKSELISRQVIIDGIIGIQKGVNPRMLQEALKAALPPKLRVE